MQYIKTWHFNMVPRKGKKTVLTIKGKSIALTDLKKGLTKKNVTEKSSVPQNTLTYWIKHKQDIISKYESCQLFESIIPLIKLSINGL